MISAGLIVSTAQRSSAKPSPPPLPDPIELAEENVTLAIESTALSSESDSYAYVLAVALLVGALLSRAAGGVVQEKHFSKHGIHITEVRRRLTALTRPPPLSPLPQSPSRPSIH